jgi:thioredoxin 1
MNKIVKVAIPVVFVAIIVGLFFVKTMNREAVAPSPATPEVAGDLPRLVDLGADSCLPCIEMAPILKELQEEYQGKIAIHFVDVYKNSEAAKFYQIRLIPTQIFFDVQGKELWRHEGFMSKEEIKEKFRELGME